MINPTMCGQLEIMTIGIGVADIITFEGVRLYVHGTTPAVEIRFTEEVLRFWLAEVERRKPESGRSTSPLQDG